MLPIHKIRITWIVLFLASLLGLSISVWKYLEPLPFVQGEITKSWSTEGSIGAYAVAFDYQYQVNDFTYYSHVQGDTSDWNQQYKWLQEHQPGTRITVYYRSEDPREHSLNQRDLRSPILIAAISVMLILSVTFLVLVLIYWVWLEAPSSKKETEIRMGSP